MKCPQCEAQNPEDSRYCFHCATPLPFPEETIIIDGKAAFRPREKFKPSGLFAGRYEIVKELGGGGMGQVYKARDKKLNRYVALKFLAPGLSGREEAKSRFIQEAQAASVLDHQNICTICEIDETPAGQMYIAMAYYEGETLKQFRKRMLRFGLKKYLYYATLIPHFLADQDFRNIMNPFSPSANKICFEREIMDHFRMVLEKI